MSSHLPPYHVISTDSQPTQSSLNFFVSAIDRLGILPVNKRRNLGESSILLEGKAEGEEEGREADLNLSSLNNERKSKEKEVTVPIGVVVDSVITGESSENSKNNKAIVTKERKSGRKRKVVEREEDATDKPESLKDAERKSSRIKSIKKRKKVDTKNGDPISSKGPHTEKQAGGKKNAKERPSKKDNRGGKGKDPLMVPTQSNNVDRVNAVVFKSKITGETYLMPPSTASYKPQRNPFISWCFKTGKWVDSRKNKYPCSSHNWSSVLQDEMIDFCAVVVLEDKEISMIERMLGGKRAEGYSAYKHLSETCNVEDSLLRAYVNLGKEIDGHPFGTKGDTTLTKMYIEQGQDGQYLKFDNEDDASIAKVFEDPRLVFTGLPNDGVPIDTFAKIWADHDFRHISNRAIAKILRRQKGVKAYTGDYVKGDYVMGLLFCKFHRRARQV